MPEPFIDWISATLPFFENLYDSDSYKWVTDRFGDPVELPHGIRGYSHSAALPDRGIIAWTPERPDLKLYLMLSSKALSAWPLTSLDLICDIIRAGGTFSRIDVAMDDKGENGVLLNMDRIGRALWSRACSTRFGGFLEVNSALVGDEVYPLNEFSGGPWDKPGRTFYIGSRSSESFVRIYDKRCEVIAKWDDVNGELPELPAHWVRFEVETKGTRADALAHALAGGHDPAGYCASLIEFKRKSKEDTNRSRWPIAPWWRKFLDGHEKQPLSMPRGTIGLEDMLSWLESQVSGSLYVAHEIGEIGRLLDKGKRKFDSSTRLAKLQAGERVRGGRPTYEKWSEGDGSEA